MKLDALELQKLEQQVLAWEQQKDCQDTAGSRAGPLSLTGLLDQRRRALEPRVD